MPNDENYRLKKEVVIIEYPGLIKDEKNMINSLGGIINISRTFSRESGNLELRFHYENPFNKPSYGELIENCGLLLKVQVKRPKKSKIKSAKYLVDVMGFSKRIVKFQNLGDFQFLPIIKQCDTKFKFLLPNVNPKSIADVSIFENHGVFTLFSVPSNFARSDIVHKRLFRSDLPDEDGNHDILGVVHKTSFDSRHVVSFNTSEPFPTKANPGVVKRMKIKYVSDEQFGIVKKLFDECPIWTRIALLYETGIKEDKLKCIIPSLAYYFSSGPWRTMYVRFGYDPRTNFNSRFYQTFDFRLRFGSGVSDLVLNRQTIIKKKRQDDDHRTNDLVHDIHYPYFEAHKLPRSRQVIYRYSDIRMPAVQELLENIPKPSNGAFCDEKNGWLPDGFDAQVRLIVSNVIRQLLLSISKKSAMDGVRMEEYSEKQSLKVGNEDKTEEELSKNYLEFFDDKRTFTENGLSDDSVLL